MCQYTCIIKLVFLAFQFLFNQVSKTSETTLYVKFIQLQHNYINNMKGLILLGLLCTLAVQQTVLISSSATNTLITSPPGLTVALSNFHETHPTYSNYIGFGANWIYKAGSSSWPIGDTATFTAQFYADCESPATLVASADNTFIFSINGGPAVLGNNFPTKSYISIKIFCGLNTLVINVTNQDNGSPAGLIFAVTQDQKKCYLCQGAPLTYYNRDTCKCECIEGCRCTPTNPSFIWQGYPTCGCTCAVANKCQDYQYWDDKTCTCKCKKVVCPPNFYQDMKTCKCIKKCIQTVACPKGFYWNPYLCKCVFGLLDTVDALVAGQTPPN